ncbi:hypothetical protein F2P44_24330 [Massilia sp. CCM 8695]|uniref:Uncharacterized protein n=1 Tax=Massilia frigida TaxID=2609281 RepID=A0ABX0NIL4_9BURK|nr:hypothetical protein [Massilia frigida]NHZ82385.1 hypothetical protein [Massilia frigida]
MVLEKPAAPTKDGKPAKRPKSHGTENAGDTFKLKAPATTDKATSGATDPAARTKDAPANAGNR